VKKLNLKNRSIALLIVGMLGLSSSNIHAQVLPGTISFGFNAGGNKFYGNNNSDQFAFQGMAFIRWNIMDWLSLHAAYNGGVLTYKTTAQSIANENNLWGPNSTGSSGGAIGSVNHTRDGGWDLMLSGNVFPSQSFVPYFIGGLEALNFEPDDATPSPLKGNAAGAYSKNVIGGVFGVGFEMYLSPKITFNGMGLLHLTGTDWLDDYSSGNTSAPGSGGTQVGNSSYGQDAYVTMGLGFSYYIFSPDVPVAPDVSGGTTTNNYNTNNYRTENNNIYHTDTLFIQNPTDTVYLVNPKINTIFNFPGTLFVVNSDQFNNTQPGNMGNLYHILSLVNQCPNLRVEIQGYASEEGGAQHNQDLSDRRAARIKGWLIDQGVSPNKIAGTIGYGDTRPAVRERSDVSASELEAERAQNRRIAVRVVQACQ
jgi:outer membrane protein OmpA-like peptidoglycan-associated protein